MLIRNLRGSTVVVADPDFDPVTFEPHGTVEVPDVLGRRLAEQPRRWTPVEDEPDRQEPADDEEN